MVPKAGLYQRGLLKSLMAWAIPASLLAIHAERDSFHFVSFCGLPYQFVAFPNTCLTLTPSRCADRGTRQTVMFCWIERDGKKD